MSIDLTPYEYERILVGYMLNFEEAPKYVLPWLTHDKFIHSTTGQIEGSKDFARIWQAITDVYLVDRLPINATTVLKKLNEDKNTAWSAYLKALESSFRGYFGIREFNPAELESYAEKVIKSGTAYYCSVKSYKVAKWLENYEDFSKFVNSPISVVDWLRGYVGNFSDLMIDRTEGYTHISNGVEKTRALAAQIYKGDQLLLLPIGMPSIHLPLGKLSVIMGESNAGKSLLVHQCGLGAAIGLKHFGVQGCICINSLEEDESDLILKLAGLLSSVDMYRFKFGEGISQEEKYRLDRAFQYIETLPLYIDNTNNLAGSMLQYRIEGLHGSTKGPVWHTSIDYLELMATDEDAQNKEQSLDKNIHKCFEISRTTGANVTVLSQVTLGAPGTNPKFRIAGPDGARYSRAIRHAADVIYEWVNYPELKKAGIEPACPAGLNTEQPFLLCSKHRGGPKYDPVGFGWQPEYSRVFDTALNKEGHNQVTLFSHPLPTFEMVESSAF